jgi:hypothetical protein
MHSNDYNDVNLNNDPNFVETQKKDQQNIDKCLNSTGTDDVAP